MQLQQLVTRNGYHLGMLVRRDFNKPEVPLHLKNLLSHTLQYVVCRSWVAQSSKSFRSAHPSTVFSLKQNLSFGSNFLISGILGYTLGPRLSA